MIHIFSMDSQANQGRGEPNLIYGFFPVFLPRWLIPWQPLVETMVFEVLILDRCVISNISGILSALIFPQLVKTFSPWILKPASPVSRRPRSRRTLTRPAVIDPTTNELGQQNDPSDNGNEVNRRIEQNYSAEGDIEEVDENENDNTSSEDTDEQNNAIDTHYHPHTD